MRALIVLLVAIFSCSPSMANEHENSIKEVYRGSTNLPDWAAYSIFLEIANAHANELGHEDRFYKKVLNLDADDPDGASRIDFYRAWFFSSKSQADEEMASKTLAVVCPVDWQSMTFDEVIAAMEQRSSEQERIYKEHYEATLQQLTKPELKAFLNYLEGLKKRTAAVTFDKREYYAQRPSGELGADQERLCDRSANVLNRKKKDHL